MSSFKRIVLMLTLIGMIQLVALQALAVPAGNTNKNEPEPLSMEEAGLGGSGFMFLAGNDCQENEEPQAGRLPECEPTCANPRPICNKMFYAGLDHVFCFCKAPLVRDTRSKNCVKLEDCPKKQ